MGVLPCGKNTDQNCKSWNQHRPLMLPVCREIMSEHNEILGMPGISLTFLAGGQLVFTGRQDCLKWTFLLEKRSTRCSNQASKIIITACPFARCLALNETSGILVRVHYAHESNLLKATLYIHILALLLAQGEGRGYSPHMGCIVTCCRIGYGFWGSRSSNRVSFLPFFCCVPGMVLR